MNTPTQNTAEILNLAPKQLCEDVSEAHSKEIFIMGMRSGNSLSAYVFTPSHMKRAVQLLTHSLAEYEKQFGKIDTPDWTPGTLSPIQIAPPNAQK